MPRERAGERLSERVTKLGRVLVRVSHHERRGRVRERDAGRQRVGAPPVKERQPRDAEEPQRRVVDARDRRRRARRHPLDARDGVGDGRPREERVRRVPGDGQRLDVRLGRGARQVREHPRLLDLPHERRRRERPCAGIERAHHVLDGARVRPVAIGHRRGPQRLQPTDVTRKEIDEAPPHLQRVRRARRVALEHRGEELARLGRAVAQRVPQHRLGGGERAGLDVAARDRHLGARSVPRRAGLLRRPLEPREVDRPLRGRRRRLRLHRRGDAREDRRARAERRDLVLELGAEDARRRAPTRPPRRRSAAPRRAPRADAEATSIRASCASVRARSSGFDARASSSSTARDRVASPPVVATVASLRRAAARESAWAIASSRKRSALAESSIRSAASAAASATAPALPQAEEIAVEGALEMRHGFEELPLRHVPLGEAERDDGVRPELPLGGHQPVKAGPAALHGVERLGEEEGVEGGVGPRQRTLDLPQGLDREAGVVRRARAAHAVLEAPGVQLRRRPARRDLHRPLRPCDRRADVVGARRGLRGFDEEIAAGAGVVGDGREVLERPPQLRVVAHRAGEVDAEGRRLAMRRAPSRRRRGRGRSPPARSPAACDAFAARSSSSSCRDGSRVSDATRLQSGAARSLEPRRS